MADQVFSRPLSDEDFSPSADESILDRYVDLLKTAPSEAAKLEASRPDLADLFTCLRTLDLLSAQLSEDKTIIEEALELPPREGDQLELTEVSSVDNGLPRAHRMAPELGDFGRYRLLEEIGRGGMGVVFRAEQIDLKRVVALKMILGNHVAQPFQVKRFYREATSAGRMRHPHIVGVHEVGVVNGQHFFSMDYVPGENLAQRLRRGPMTEEQALRILLPIVDGVEFLHQHGIVHRDLKPSNILLDQQGTPYISDFGLARLLESDDSQTDTGCMLGSIHYMPPEQARGEPQSTTPRSDVYALGAILFEMLTGQPPFQGTTKIDTLLKLLQGEPPLPRSLNPRISKEMQAICLRCLAYDQEQRYPSAESLAQDFRRLQRGEAIQIPSEGWLAQSIRWCRRFSALSARLGGILLVFIIIQSRWMYDGFDLKSHLRNIMILFGWGGMAFLNQHLISKYQQRSWLSSAMSVVDCLMLTSLLFLADGPLGALWSIYTLLILTAGLSLRTATVIVTTVTTMLCSILLYFFHPSDAIYAHYLLIHLVLLGLVAMIVTQQIKRIRILDRYCDQLRV